METTILSENGTLTDLLLSKTELELEYAQEIQLLKMRKLNPTEQCIDYILDKIKEEI